MPDGSVWGAKCWGVEELSTEDRVAKIIDAGCDQLGGERLPEVVVSLVRSGRIPEERIDESARRILRDKFRLGLFDDPFVDPDVAGRACGQPEFVAAGERAQRRSAVLIKYDGTMPLSGGEDVAIVRKTAPFEPRTDTFIESVFHAGDLDFKEPELGELLELARSKPTVLVLHLERPAVIPELVAECAAVLAVFGASDGAVEDLLYGRSQPEGTLPFELPSPMGSVRAQKPDVPGDSEEPLFRFGHGLFY